MTTNLSGIDGAASALSADELLDHAAGLRRLARRLVRDDAEADDVVQETWLRALEHAPRNRAALGAWLQRVLRNRVLDRRRAEARRIARERRAAAGERLPSSADEADQRAALASVVQAVLALPEPYQTTIWRRFFDDIPPREIARREAIPVATVKSRMVRGLAMLRQVLDGEHGGGRRAWALALAPFAYPSPAATGALLPLAVAAGALAGLTAWAAWGGESGAIATPMQVASSPTAGAASIRPAGTADDPLAAIAAARLPVPLESGERIPVMTETPIDNEGAAPATHVIDVLVLGDDDRPQPGVVVRVGPRLHPFSTGGTTDQSGRVRIAWHAQAASMVVLVAAGDVAQDYVQVTVRADVPAKAFIRLPKRETEGDASVRFAYEHRTAERRVESKDGRSLLSWRDHESASSTAMLHLFDSRIALDFTAELVTTFEGQVLLQLPGDLENKGGATIAGRIVDPFHGPAANTAVHVEQESGRTITRTDDLGRFWLSGLEPGPARIRAGGGRFGVASDSLELVEGSVWEPALDRGRELTGRLVGHSSEALAGWIVVATSADSSAPWTKCAVTRDDGGFSIAGCTDVPLDVSAAPRTGLPQLGAPLVEGILAGGAPLFLLASDAARGEIRIAVDDPRGDPIEGVEGRLVSLSSGRGLRLRAADGGYHADRLPPDAYRIELIDAERGALDLGVISLAARERLDLGRVILPDAGRFDFVVEHSTAGAAASAELTFDVRRLCHGFESVVWSSVRDGWPDGQLAIPRGTYRATLRRGQAVVCEEVVSLAPGAVTTLPIPFRPEDEVHEFAYRKARTMFDEALPASR